MLLDEGGEREAPPYLDGWDYNTQLQLRRNIRVETAVVCNETGIAASAPLLIVVSVFSTSTWLRRTVFSDWLAQPVDERTLEITIDGDELGGTLRLSTAVLLAAEHATRSPFTAHLPTSILWHDRTEIRLQGDAPLFPISVVDFSAAGFEPGAGWHLEIGTDLAAPLHAAIRLYLNRADPVVVGAFARAAAPAPEDTAVLRAVRADVARVMIEHALNQDELRSDGEWEPESLGFALRRLLDRYFPHADLDAVLLQRVEHPGDFSTELFGRLGVFGG